jgi:phage terminase large subunit
LRIFENCKYAIKNIPLLQYHDTKIEDAANEPHEVTHACEAIRYGITSRPKATDIPKPEPIHNFEFEKPKPSPVGVGDTVIDI